MHLQHSALFHHLLSIFAIYEKDKQISVQPYSFGFSIMRIRAGKLAAC